MFNRRRIREATGVSAVIAAGGTSQRMGFDKLTAELYGLPVLLHTINAFELCDEIDEIIVVTRGESIPILHAAVKYEGYKKLRSIVKGGETRQQSVYAGVMACASETELVCIHDGARPLVTEAVILSAVAAARRYGAATAAVPVKDTIKQNDGGFVSKTLPRETLMQVQTPQVFRKVLYLQAYAQNGADYSDDCQLIESLGIRVAFSQGDYQNIKLTTEEDLIVAEAFLQHREGY